MSDGIEALLNALAAPYADLDYHPGHERIRALLASMGCSKPRFRIRVVGTNGKGSTAAMLACALQDAGFRVGLYTSPHVLRFNERIRVDGAPADDECLREGLTTLGPAIAEVRPSYFEIATALACYCFTKAKVDVEILEAGVGGRLDATTALDADMALISPIGLDHQAWLGQNIEDIAAEKAYAMDGCLCALSAPQTEAALAVLAKHRPDLSVVPVQAWPSLSMPGRHQWVNASLAYGALQRLVEVWSIPIDLAQAKHAIACATLPGRLQRCSYGDLTVWLDAAHNEHALRALLPSLPELADPFDLIVCYHRADRDLSGALDLLRPHTRSLRHGIVCEDLEEVIGELILAQGSGKVLILGSFQTVGAALRWLSVNRARVPQNPFASQPGRYASFQ